jgi:hypothetical protein
MKASQHPPKGMLGPLLLCCFTLLALSDSSAADAPGKQSASSSAGLVPLELKLPAAAFIGTPPDQAVISPYTEPYDPDKKRPPMMVPKGLKNVATNKETKITCSNKTIPADSLAKINDGDKEGADPSILLLPKGTQWVQLDFGNSQEIFAIALWHAHDQQKAFHDVVVQVADDAEFTSSVKTLFNNDQDNSSGLGVGTDREYFEDNQGKLINAKGVTARCVRFYSRGSTHSPLNEYTEIEVYGRPAASVADHKTH